MKKLQIVTIVVALIAFYITGINAQTTPMNKGTQHIMAGIGMGGYDGGTSPTFMVTYQRGVKDNWGKGNLSVGGTIAFKSGHFRNYTLSRANYSYFALAGRASYHPHFIKSEQWDLYGGLGLGYYSVSTDFDFAGDFYDYGASTIAFTGHIGIRYVITDTWNAWAELGNELSVLSLGAGYSF